MRHPSYAEGNSPVQQIITVAKKNTNLVRRPRRKTYRILFSKRYDAFFWTGVMLKFANSPIPCANVNILHRGGDGFSPYMVGSEKGPPKQQNKR